MKMLIQLNLVPKSIKVYDSYPMLHVDKEELANKKWQHAVIVIFTAS